MKLSKIKEFFKKHLLDSTSIALTSTPIYAYAEYRFGGFSVCKSLKARLLTIFLLYIGLGFLIAGLRKLSQAFFLPQERNRPKYIHFIHDSLFNILVVMILTPIVYSIVGETLAHFIGIIPAIIVIPIFSGALYGLSIDVFRVLVFDESNRTAKNFVKLTILQKRALAVCFMLSALIITFLVYRIPLF